MSLLGIDVGTTGCKAVIFDAAGQNLAAARREYPLTQPQDGFWELDPELVWQQVQAAIGEVAKAPVEPVTALAISALGEAILPINRNGMPLAAGAISADMRAINEIDLLLGQIDRETVYAITGQPATAYYSLPKMMWWQRHKPEIYAATYKFVCFGEYVLARLGLDPVMDATMAARTLAYDINDGVWSEPILDAAGIDLEKLPQVLPSGSVIGRLGTTGAERTGLSPDVVVVTGCFDQACAAFAVGVVEQGEGFHGLGTTEALALAIRKPDPSLTELNIAVIPHVVPDMLLAMAGSQTGGRLLGWFRDEFCVSDTERARRKNRDAYDLILDGMTPEPGMLMVLPHFTGSGSLDADPDSLGAILGLSFKAGRQDLAKVILNGITYEQALSLARMREKGCTPRVFPSAAGLRGRICGCRSKRISSVANSPASRFSMPPASGLHCSPDWRPAFVPRTMPQRLPLPARSPAFNRWRDAIRCMNVGSLPMAIFTNGSVR